MVVVRDRREGLALTHVVGSLRDGCARQQKRCRYEESGENRRPHAMTLAALAPSRKVPS